MRINAKDLKLIVDDINNKCARNHISYITAINSTDVVFGFSFYNKEKLFISLNHSSPVIGFIDKNYTFPTFNGNLSEGLRKNIKDSYVLEVSLLNNDRVVIFTLGKTNEFFEKETYYLVIELIPTRCNLIILIDKKEVIYAYHYSDLTNKHPVVKGLVYEPLQNSNVIEDKSSISIDEYKAYVNERLLEAINKRKKELYQPLYDFLVSKRKSQVRKIDVLNEEIEKSNINLQYKEYGDYIYAYLYDKEELDKYILTLGDKYDRVLTPIENANLFYKKYKKFKRTIELDKEELNKCHLMIEEIDDVLRVFPYLDEEEYKELYNKYLSFKMKKKLKVKGDANLPYFIKYNGVLIGFGKNKIQNDYLTFKKSHKEYIFLHINNDSGSHVVIFDENPSNEVLQIASEIALILSNQIAGEVKKAIIKDIKKGPSIGQVIINKYETFVIKEIDPLTYELLTKQTRFTK